MHCDERGCKELLRAEYIINPDITSIDSAAMVAESITMMRDYKLRSIIVRSFNSKELHGMLNETDIVNKVIAKNINPENIQVEDIMTKPCLQTDSNQSILQIVQLFARNNMYSAPVIKKKLIGNLSVTDILQKS